MVTFTLKLPAEVHFRLSEDYAKHCGGQPLAIEKSPTKAGELSIFCDERVFSASSSGMALVYDKASVIGIVEDGNELFHGNIICTVRVVFKEPNGDSQQVMTLPFLTASIENRKSFTAFVNELFSYDFNIATYRSPEEFDKAMWPSGC